MTSILRNTLILTIIPFIYENFFLYFLSHLSDNLVEFKILSWKPFSPQNFEVFPSCLLASSIIEKSIPVLTTNVYNLLIFIDKFIYF